MVMKLTDLFINIGLYIVSQFDKLTDVLIAPVIRERVGHRVRYSNFPIT